MEEEITARDGTKIIPERVYYKHEIADMFCVGKRTVELWIRGAGLRDWDNGVQRYLKTTWLGGSVAVRGRDIINFARATTRREQ